MARIDKHGPGYTTSSEETAGATTTVTVPNPRPGWAVRILRVWGYMRGGTSNQIRLNYQSSVVAGAPDPIGINRQLIERDRSVNVGEIDVDCAPGVNGGNGHQVSLVLNGNVADSTLCGLFVDWKIVKV
jgi:hypothetical protein